MTVIMKKIKIFLTALACAVMVLPLSGQSTSMRDRLKEHVYILADDSMAGRKAGSEGAAKAADYIAGQFEKIGAEPYFNGSYFQNFHPAQLLGKSNKECRNVAAVIHGNDPWLKDEYIVIGAHYDHIGMGQNTGGDNIYNGADDNASGVAALIELADQLYANRSLLNRSVILVAFDAEELGLHGSRYFVSNLDFPIGDIKLMMSVDMVGWYQVSQALYYYGAGTLKDSKSAFSLSAAQILGLNVISGKFENKLGVTTDTEPFATKGVPTFYVTTGLKSPYHRPEDEAGLIDYAGLAKITGHLTVMVSHFANDKAAVEPGKQAFRHRRQDHGFEFGIVTVAGSNYFNYTSGNERGKSAASYGGGVYGQMNLGLFGLRPELRYERMGAKNAEGKLWMNSIVVPFSLVLQTPKNVVAGTYISAGAYYRHMFSGHQKGNSANLKNIYHRNEIGAQWSVGAWYDRIGMAVERRYGCSKLLRNAGDRPNYKNKTTYFTLTYAF